jgi:hypothetical protein
VNTFARFGIANLSASQLNCWRAAPAKWVLEKLVGFREDGNAKMARGRAIELMLDHYYNGGLKREDATEFAKTAFDTECQGVIDDEHDAERKKIAAYTEVCLIAAEANPGYQRWPNARDERVELWIDGIPVPIIGYPDYRSKLGPIFDLKTTDRIQVRSEHIRQAAIYAKATGRPSSLLYVSPSKWIKTPDLTDDEIETAIAELRKDAFRLMFFLSRCDSSRDALAMLPIDPDNFRWSPAAIEAANKALGVAA